MLNFDTLLKFFERIDPVLGAFIASLFTWLLTALGSSLVFFIKTLNRQILDGMLGFTGGVMIAASYWSLLAPAIEMTSDVSPNLPIWFPSSVGFIMGAFFLFFLDKFMPHLHINFDNSEGIKTNWQKTTLLVLAITLHNIPEGLAVGVLFGAVSHGLPGAEISTALVLAIGIALQNFPEGIAVSMPLRRQGVSRFRAFWFGQLSAIVEPIFAVIGAILVVYTLPILPYALSFAAGAMIYIVIEEVVPESQQDNYTDTSTIGFIIGFVVMMILDTSLG